VIPFYAADREKRCARSVVGTTYKTSYTNANEHIKIMSTTSTHHSSTESAIIYSNDLIHQLENNPAIRLPTTYIGVRRIRPKLVVAVGRSGTSKVDDNNDKYPVKKRKHSSDIKDNKDDDDWVPNYNVTNSSNSSSCKSNNTTNDQQSSNISKEEEEVIYKVTNPDGTKRRMTTQEKKQLKYQLKQTKHKLKKDKKQRKHEEHNLNAKMGKMERRQMKRFGRMNMQTNQQQQEKEDEEEVDVEKRNCNVELSSINQASGEHDNHDERESSGEKKDIPPVMLTPAATCIARDMGILPSVQGEEATSSYQQSQTIMDPILAAQWATQLQQSMIPAETSRAQEEIRPMAYRLVPEVWKRLCPDTLWTEKNSKEEEEEEDCVKKICSLEKVDDDKRPTSSSSTATSLAIIRNPSPSYDTDASILFRHLHQHSKLHISCGAAFGCDFLLYDGKRDERHSFAGLRVYSSSNKEKGIHFPIPTAYDMMGFVRSMNTARKIALIATVVRENGDGATPRVLIVDLALEKVLTAPTHIRKGNTIERRSEEESASELAKQRL